MNTTVMNHEKRRERRQRMADRVNAGATPGEVANDFGVCLGTVYAACEEFSVAINDRRGKGPSAVRLAAARRWESVDWNMQDHEISALLGVTRERVRQVRRGRGAGNARFHGQRKESARVRAWLGSHRDQVPHLSLTQITALLPFQSSREMVQAALKSLGMSCAERVNQTELVTKETLYQFVTVDPVRGCWEWNGSRNPQTGYGQIGGGYAHRLAFQLFNGAIPRGKWILHSCDNPPCCNPNHLYAGTAQDNARDRDSRGRDGVRMLSVEAVMEIREAFKRKDTSAKSLADKFGVTSQVIYGVWRGQTYRTLPESVSA